MWKEKENGIKSNVPKRGFKLYFNSERQLIILVKGIVVDVVGHQ